MVSNSLNFPCKFPIKIMTTPQKEVIKFILNTLKQWITKPKTIDFKNKRSKNGEYTSITVTFEALNKKQLDAIYYFLGKHQKIYMVS